MKRNLLLNLFGSFLFAISPLAGQSEPFPSEGGVSTLSKEQDRLFDELLETEVKRDPAASNLIQNNPAQAAELVEESDPILVESPQKSPVTGTFLQLNRECADFSTEEWRKALAFSREAGLTEIIVQWTATDTIAYFEPAPERYTETHPTVNRLLDAAADLDLKVILGLSHDPRYWKNINTRADVIDVYFRVRNTQNLFLQEFLLETFGENKVWTGYYISEEIDDLNWREPSLEIVFHQFLLRSGRIIRERDEERSIAISSFFRKRTAPSTFATNLRNLMSATEIGQLWIQDGIGVELLSSSLIEPYYQAIARNFSQPPPNVGIVVELFEQTSPPNEPFKADPALPGRVERQLRDASLLGSPITLFSLFDYADPSKGGRQKEVYEVIRKWNGQDPALKETTIDDGETTTEDEPSSQPDSEPSLDLPEQGNP